MRRLGSGRMIGIILAAAMLVTAVPAEAYAKEDTFAAETETPSEENMVVSEGRGTEMALQDLYGAIACEDTVQSAGEETTNGETGETAGSAETNGGTVSDRPEADGTEVNETFEDGGMTGETAGDESASSETAGDESASDEADADKADEGEETPDGTEKDGTGGQSAEDTGSENTVSDDSVSDNIMSEGASVDEILTDEDGELLSLDGVPLDKAGGDIPSGYLRDGAVNVEVVAGTSKYGVLGDDVRSAIYSYKVGSDNYRALYIWSETSSPADLKGYSVNSDQAYGQIVASTLTDIILDDSITEITTGGMFEELSKVSYVRLSSKLKSFSNGLFSECTSLESITIPKTLETAQGNTFWKCTSLETINFEDGIKKIPDKFTKNGDSYDTDTNVELCHIKTVNIPASVTDIGDEAFVHLRHLEAVNFMDPSHTTLAHIGNSAFGDTNLRSITLPRFGGKWYDPYSKKTYTAVIEELAFDHIRNSAFTTLIIPEGVVSIPAIWQVCNLDYIYLPSTLKCTDRAQSLLSGAFNTFMYPMPSGIKQIYYNGSEDQFFKTGLKMTMSSERKSWKTNYSEVYAKLTFNTVAPKQVSGIEVPSDKTAIIKYIDDITTDPKMEYIYLTISPVDHLDNTEFKAESSDNTIVEAVVGEESGGKLLLTLKYHKKKTLEPVTVTVTGGLAIAKITIIIKDKLQAMKPIFKVNGKPVSGTVDVKKGDWVIAESETDGSIVEYTIGGNTREWPDGLVVGSDIFAGAEEGDPDITIQAQAIRYPAFNPSPIASVTLSYKLDMGDVNDYDKGEYAFIPEGLWIGKDFYDTPSYTGAPITAADIGVKVFYYNKFLRYGKDYTVTYSDNVDSYAVSGNKAKLTIKGKSPYNGSADAEFVIEQGDMNYWMKGYVDYTPATLAYTGKDEAPDIDLKYNGRKLIRGKDYSLKYQVSNEYSGNPQTDTIKNSGRYNVFVYGEGNYCGNYEIKDSVYIVKKAEYDNMADVEVAKIKDQQLVKKGVGAEPEIKVIYKGKPVGSDAYMVSYKHNDVAGTATAIITGTRAGASWGDKTVAFMGTKTVTFKVKPIPMSKVSVTADPVIYEGTALRPSHMVKLGDDQLTIGIDYNISYKNNIKAGKGSVIVTGKGAFKGKKTVKFTIQKATLTDGNVTLPGGATYNYALGGPTPEVIVKLGDVILSKKDYKVSYSYDSGNGTVTVTGKGSCTGTVKKSFYITGGDLKNCRTTFADKKYANKANIYKQKLTIKDVNGKKLKAGRDYESVIKYTYNEDTKVKQKDGKKSYKYVWKSAGEEVSSNDIIPAKSTILATVIGKGNYAGTELKGTFRFGSKSISSVKFGIKNQQFTGSRILPGKELITAKGVDADQYEIIGYGTNVKIGTGTVTVRGKGDYIGTKTIKFKIVK